MIYSYFYVSSSASVFLFPVPPDFSFEQRCSPSVLSDFSQSTGLEHWVGLSTRNTRTKTEIDERAVPKPPSPPPPAPLLPQGGSAVQAGGIAKAVFAVSSGKAMLSISSSTGTNWKSEPWSPFLPCQDRSSPFLWHPAPSFFLNKSCIIQISAVLRALMC